MGLLGWEQVGGVSCALSTWEQSLECWLPQAPGSPSQTSADQLGFASLHSWERPIKSQISQVPH